MAVRLWQDNGNNYPGALMQSFQTVLSAVDAEGANITVHPSMVRAFASFSNPISVLANTRYWIGMSGNSSFYGLGQYALFGLNAPGDGLAAQFNDTTFQGLSTIGDQAFRLHGDTTTTTAVPTPALLPGLIGLGVAAFRKRKSGKVEA